MTKDLMEKAKEYSFNIESQLFPTLSTEQQKMWKAEIEQAYVVGAGSTQEQISRENLNDAASRTLKETPIPELPGYAFEKGFKLGAEWQKEKMIRWLEYNINTYIVSSLKSYKDIDYIFDDLRKL